MSDAETRGDATSRPGISQRGNAAAVPAVADSVDSAAVAASAPAVSATAAAPAAAASAAAVPVAAPVDPASASIASAAGAVPTAEVPRVASPDASASEAPAAAPRRSSATAFIACFFAYLIVIEAFLAVSQFNEAVQIRPASALGPVLGLFFGLPGILGCASANLVSDALHEGTTPFMLVIYFAIQVMYDGLPRWLWYALNRNAAQPYLRFESAAQTALYMVLSLVDSVCVCAAGFASIGAPPDRVPTYVVYTLNNMWMLLYVGLPLLFALERSPLVSRPPHWIRVPYRSVKQANLTQRLVIVFTIASTLLLLVVSLGINFFASGSADFSVIVNTMYVAVAVLAVPVFLPMFAFLGFVERHFTRPIEVLANDQETFIQRMEADAEQGRRDTKIAVNECGTKPRHEVADLFASTNKMRTDLVGFIERLHAVTSEQQRAAAELDIAAQIQMGAVPHDFSSFTERFALDIAGYMRPAREVGGDFYDAFEVGEHGVAFVIGDVSGKGVPAALFMMRAQSLLRQYLLEADDLGTAFTLANRQLCERNDAMLFVTAFACVVDTATGEVRYANAGHNPPVLRLGGKQSYLKCRPGLVLGAMDVVKYREGQFTCSPGDGLLLYTDGVSEASNSAQEMFGEDRLLEALERADELGSGEGVLAGADGGEGPTALVAPALDSAVSDAPAADAPVADAPAADAPAAVSAPDSAAAARMSAADTVAPAVGASTPSVSMAQTAVNTVVATVDAFAGEAPQADDITMLAFRWNLPVRRLTLPPRDEQLYNLFAFLEPACQGAGRTQRMMAQLMLVCEEVFVNICHYGFPDGQPRLPVDIELAADERAGCLHLVFSDQGIAYDPLAHEAKKVDPTDDERKGGLGILLMRTYMDDLRYTRTDGRNILRMTKRFV